jgi:hypothetical protein
MLSDSRPSSASVMKIDASQSPPLSIDVPSRVSSFDQLISFPFSSRGVAPGEILKLTGQNLGPPDAITPTLDQTQTLPKSLGGVAVEFDGIRGRFSRYKRIRSFVSFRSGWPVKVLRRFR